MQYGIKYSKGLWDGKLLAPQTLGLVFNPPDVSSIYLKSKPWGGRGKGIPVAHWPVSQLSFIHKSQTPVRDPDSKNKVGASWGMTPRLDPGIHMHMHTHTPVHTDVYHQKKQIF